MILTTSPLLLTSSLAAAVGYLVLAAGHRALGPRVTQGMLAITWFLHGASLLIYWVESPGRFGFASAMSVTAWMVSTIYGIETQLQPKLRARWTLAALGAAAILLNLLYPGTVHPRLPSIWLPLHWALGIASYGLIGAAVFHALLLRRADDAMRNAHAEDGQLPVLVLERLMFQFVTAGFIFLTATLVAGAGFAEVLYGSGWRWDHKTVFSVLAWLSLGTLLLARWRLGWRGKRAARLLYASAGLLLMGYVGTRFVLEVLLNRA
jgi:ABC-type uncharacterized transport system permease subunit